jgi:hypothetical protein
MLKVTVRLGSLDQMSDWLLHHVEFEEICQIRRPSFVKEPDVLAGKVRKAEEK